MDDSGYKVQIFIICETRIAGNYVLEFLREGDMSHVQHMSAVPFCYDMYPVIIGHYDFSHD